MKNFFLLLGLLVALSVSARDKLYIEDFTIKAGHSETVDLLLINDTVYSAFQTDLYLPQGLELETEDDEFIIVKQNDILAVVE